MMKKLISLIVMLTALTTYGADNEIYVDQSGTGANIDLEQLGISNTIGGLNSTAGSLNAFDLDGATMTLDINMIGNTNKFLGDINATTFTGLYNFTGDTNTFTIQVDPTNTYSSAGSDQNIAVTGSSNTFTLNQGTTAIAANLNLDWIIQGSSNTVTSNINIDGATNYMDIDGSDNTINYTGTGVNASAGGYFWLDHTGGQRTFNIQQLSTQDNDWLKIISNGGNASSTVCVIQNDQGTSTSC